MTKLYLNCSGFISKGDSIFHYHKGEECSFLHTETGMDKKVFHKIRIEEGEAFGKELIVSPNDVTEVNLNESNLFVAKRDINLLSGGTYVSVKEGTSVKLLSLLNAGMYKVKVMGGEMSGQEALVSSDALEMYVPPFYGYAEGDAEVTRAVLKPDKKLKLYYAEFNGEYPVGAVIIASARTRKEAKRIINNELELKGFKPVEKKDVRKYEHVEGNAEILLDGNY